MTNWRNCCASKTPWSDLKPLPFIAPANPSSQPRPPQAPWPSRLVALPSVSGTVTEIPRRAQVSRAANHRYLEALASTHASTPLAEAVAPLCRPITREGCRYRALHPFGKDAALLRALSQGQWAISGVRNRDLQSILYPAPPRDQKSARRRSACVSRKLRLLRAHGLLRKLPHTHRYQITASGRILLTALVTAQNASTEKLTEALTA